MTSQCGSDSPDGGAVMSEIETAIFTIITSAGEARASLYQALDKARAGEMAESEPVSYTHLTLPTNREV